MASTRNIAIMAFTKGKKAGELAEAVDEQLDGAILISEAHQQAIDEQAAALAQLETDLDTLNTSTLPNLEADLNTLNTSTLPTLQADLATIEDRTDVLTAGHVLANIASVGEVRAEHIGADTITANKIASGAITASEIATGAVTATKVSSDILTTNVINAGYMTIDKIYSGQKNLSYGAFKLGNASITVDGYTFYSEVMGICTTSSSARAGVIGYGENSVGVCGGSQTRAGVVGASTSSHGVHGQSSGAWGVYGWSSGGNGVFGITTNSGSSGAGGRSHSGTEGYLGFQSYGLYTSSNALIGGTTYPFTGAHKSYMQDTTGLIIGDIVESVDAWCVNINQALVHSKRTDTDRCKRVFGVVTEIAEDIGSAFENELYSDLEDGIWIIKDEYKPYIDYLIDNNYKEVGANAVGEGGMNVCELGGDIENGDYITSSTLAGKGMKQDDDLLHSYTVAKALESVAWSEENEGDTGVFMLNGIKCKRIAVTYHCG